jgi:hypothetical protein
MADGLAMELRIYCICGQKMKVSESMFGLPGKCVACRQKIRVPTREEVPPDTSVIYLKDHPEFLRKAKPALAKLPAGGVDIRPWTEEQEVVTLGEPAEAASATILDILEPLRVLCSLEHKAQRQSDALSRGEALGVGEDQASLSRYLEQVHTAHAGLDEQLRHRLMEVAIELASTQEKLIQAGLSARIGEIPFGPYRETADILRRRRDRLERLHQNLRGWLTVSDPHTAGGYTNVSLDSIPGDGFLVDLSPEPDDPRSLFDQHMDTLREALVRRERAELRLSEMDHVRAEGGMSASVLADCRDDCLAEQRRAEAEVLFRRKRLEQMGNDCAGDIQTTQACLDHLCKQYQTGQLDKARFGAIEREMVIARRDWAKIHGLVTRALTASTAQDVPHPSGSFLKRMVRPVAAPRVTELGLDSWITWACALALGLSVFLPLVDDLSLIQAYQRFAYNGQAIQWVLLVPVVAGALAAIIGAMPWRAPRGMALSALWLVLTLLCVVFIHETQYGQSPILARFRHGGPWLFRPGILLLVLADLGILAAAGIALVPLREARLALAGVIGAALLLMVGIVSDFGGYFVPRPQVSPTWTERGDPNRLLYDTAIKVRNRGGRALLFGTAPVDARNAFRFALERQTAPGQWQDAGILDKREMRSIPAHAEAVLQHEIPPGDYRVRLTSSKGTDAASASFSLPEAIPVPAELTEMPAPTPAPKPVKEEPPPATTAAAEKAKPAPVPTVMGVDVELRGLVNAEKRGPRFAIAVYLSNGTTRNLDLTIGDLLYDPWTVTEFNPDRLTVTISNGQQILILNRGQRVSLK